MAEVQVPPYYKHSLQTGAGSISVTVVKLFAPFTTSQVLLVKTDKASANRNLPSDSYIVLKVYDHRFLPHRIQYGNPWDYAAEANALCLFRPNQHFSFAPTPGVAMNWVGRIGIFIK